MIERRITIPEGVDITLEGEVVKAKGPNGEISRKLSYPGIRIRREGNQVVVEAEKDRRRQRAMTGTFASHINNLIKGVTEGFEYKMKVVHSHFPMSVKVSGREVIVENFLGEKTPRKTQIVGDCTVDVKGIDISIRGNNLEEVGQTAANIEQLTRVKRRDRRVFQDGIYLVERDGVEV
jgi:large subunit ribosomal protein L6